jgi:hypothetical protein
MCTTAFQSFVKKHGTGPQRTATYLEPDDELLLLMAQKANLVIPLSGFSGMAGVKAVHKWFEENQTQYNPGAERGLGDRALWGVHKNRAFVVQTLGAKSPYHVAGGFGPAALEMDCTTYVNLMLSIYLKGDAHTATYVADCSAFGGTTTKHLARERYAFPLIMRKAGDKTFNYFQGAADILEATKPASASLYVLEVGGQVGGGVSHMALLYGSDVYECTTKQPICACISRPLEAFLANKGRSPIYLFGPR